MENLSLPLPSFVHVLASQGKTKEGELPLCNVARPARGRQVRAVVGLDEETFPHRPINGHFTGRLDTAQLERSEHSLGRKGR